VAAWSEPCAVTRVARVNDAGPGGNVEAVCDERSTNDVETSIPTDVPSKLRVDLREDRSFFGVDDVDCSVNDLDSPIHDVDCRVNDLDSPIHDVDCWVNDVDSTNDPLDSRVDAVFP